MMNWTKQQARDFFVNYQMINTSSLFSIRDVFQRVKTIQMDPLNVVGTNPELVCQARIKDFKKMDLQNALYQERFLVDGWEKQMSIYETKYFPYFHLVRENRSAGALHGALSWLKLDASPYIDEVYEIVKQEGPIFSSKIKLGETKKHRWGHTKPSTVAIDYLWHKGVLGIAERKNTQKKYDLIERLHPTLSTEPYFLNQEDFIEWYLYRRIQTVGLVYSKSTVHFDGLYIREKDIRMKYLDILLQKNLIQQVSVEGIKDIFYVPTKALKIENELLETITFVAPLDNLTWDREILRQLFDFDYIWEVYTPVSKRQYGYYVLPILRGSQFIGRIEFEKQRGTDPLIIQSIQYEKHIKNTKKLSIEMNRALNKFMKYLGSKEVINNSEVSL